MDAKCVCSEYSFTKISRKAWSESVARHDKRLCIHFIQSKPPSIFYAYDRLGLYSNDIYSALTKAEKHGQINLWEGTCKSQVYTLITIFENSSIWKTPSMSFWEKTSMDLWEKMRWKKNPYLNCKVDDEYEEFRKSLGKNEIPQDYSGYSCWEDVFFFTTFS